MNGTVRSKTVFQQFYSNVPVLHSSLFVHRQKDKEPSSLHGTYFESFTVNNGLALSQADVASLLDSVFGTNGEYTLSSMYLVVTPFACGFRYMYMADIQDKKGAPFRLMIDAETGYVASVNSLILTASATGRVYEKDPYHSGSVRDVSFEVRDPPGNRYHLLYKSALSPATTFRVRDARCYTGTCQDPEWGVETTTPEFNFDPTDKEFGNVTAYWHVYSFREYLSKFSSYVPIEQTYGYQGLPGEDEEDVSVMVDVSVHDSVPLYGENQAAASNLSHPENKTVWNLYLGDGRANDYETEGWLDTSMDGTIVRHEYAHHQQTRQYIAGHGGFYGLKGQENAAINEGVADFLANSYYGDTYVALWTAVYLNPNLPDNLAADPQSDSYDPLPLSFTFNTPQRKTAFEGYDPETGDIPRSLLANETFPQHREINGKANHDPHADGAIFSWGLWQARSKLMNLYGADGNDILVDAVLNGIKHLDYLPGSSCEGKTCPPDKLMHEVFVDFLAHVFEGGLEVFGADRTWALHKLLAGFADTGINLDAADAVVDVAKNKFKSTDAAPSFLINSGEHYGYDDVTGKADPALPNDCNTSYFLWIAKDDNFGNVPVAISGNVDSCALNVTLSADEWDALKPTRRWYSRHTTRYYYRVQTSKVSSECPAGCEVRDSTRPGAGLYDLPPPSFTVTTTGGFGCSVVSISTEEPGGDSAILAACVAFLGLALLNCKRGRKQP